MHVRDVKLKQTPEMFVWKIILLYYSLMTFKFICAGQMFDLNILPLFKLLNIIYIALYAV